jgi:hypothetical protein
MITVGQINGANSLLDPGVVFPDELLAIELLRELLLNEIRRERDASK